MYAITNQKTARAKLFENPSSIPCQSPMSNSMNTTYDECDELQQQQTYQNLSEINEQAAQATQDDIYANQDQILQNQNVEGIYDNECIINAQNSAAKSMAITQQNDLNIQDHIANDHQCQSLKNSSLPPNKPPVAAKPSSLQAKIKALNNAGLSVSTVDKYIPPLPTTTTTANSDEPLKIIENEQELYCNTKTLSEQ